MPSLVSDAYRILTEEGPRRFAVKSVEFLDYRLTEYVRVPLYSFVAKVLGPIEYFGIIIPTDSPIFDDDVRSRFLHSAYEYDELQAIDRYYSEPYDLIDLGASTGFLTSYVVDRFEGEIKGVAVEGNPDLIPLLKSTRRLNDLCFEIEDSAYRSSREEIEFHKHPKTVGGSIQRETSNPVSVPSITVADLISKYTLTTPVLIADIEGGGVDLLRNELSILEDHVPLLIIEFHPGCAEGVAEAKRQLKESTFEHQTTINNTEVYMNEAFARTGPSSRHE